MGATASLPELHFPRRSDASRLPRIVRDLLSLHLPYLEIKLTFECTAQFYGLAPPLQNTSVNCECTTDQQLANSDSGSAIRRPQ